MPPGQAVLTKVVQSLASVGQFQLAEFATTQFCTVYCATDQIKHKHIGIKLMSLEALGTERARALEIFRRERDHVRKLDHPNIARLFTAGEIDGYLIWITEWLEGSTLATALAKGEPFKPWDIVDIARQIAAALDYAHHAGLVHHRFNPGNILIESDGTAKLMDFAVPPYPDLGPAASQQTATAAQYMAPEDLHRQPTSSSNLFGMGAILFHIACGKPPFESTSVQARLGEPGIAVPDSLLVNTRIHPGIAAPIAKLLSPAPADRYASGAAAVRDLERYAGFGKQAEEPQRPLKPPPVPEPVAIKVRTAPSKPVADAGTAPANGLAPPQQATIPPAAIATSKPPETIYTPPVPSPPRPTAVSKRWQIPVLSPRTLLIAVAALLLLISTITVVVLLHHKNPEATKAATESALPPDTPLPPELQAMLQQQAAQEANASEVAEPPADAGQRRRGRTRIERAPVSGPSPTSGGLVISSSPDGAKVQIDGYNICTATPCSVTAIPPGPHTVVISKEGFSVESQTVQVVAGSRLTVTVALSASGATVSVGANPPGGFILVDGVNTGRTTPARILVPHGTHTITVRSVGYVDASTAMNIRDGENLSFTPNLRIALGSDDIKQVGGIKRLFGANAPKGMGRVQVRTTPRGASVYVNGTALDKNTPAEFALRPGEYDLRIQMPGFKRVQRIVSVDSGRKILVEETLEKE